MRKLILVLTFVILSLAAVHAQECSKIELYCDGIDNDCNDTTLDNPDIDNDGVGFCLDFCPGSLPDKIIPDSNHYAQIDEDINFENGDKDSEFTTMMTYGCNCIQILEELNSEETECSLEVIQSWTGKYGSSITGNIISNIHEGKGSIIVTMLVVAAFISVLVFIKKR